MAQNVKDIH